MSALLPNEISYFFHESNEESLNFKRNKLEWDDKSHKGCELEV